MSLSETLLRRLYVGVVGLLTTVAAQRAVSSAWKLATGDRPPAHDDPDVPTATAAGWALASGLGVGVAQFLIKRSTGRRWPDRRRAAAKLKVR